MNKTITKGSENLRGLKRIKKKQEKPVKPVKQDPGSAGNKLKYNSAQGLRPSFV